ncbi:MAG TPA: LacI family DNA-binding transcriptional regulator [Terriglobia bacterium]|jgi:LacI family transcriptional regulator|nr:LacI family DNA-binding transcriptional regulator [Terriglobia bacterium]
MTPPLRAATIRDVARAAGVGIGTVSRVLNGGAEVSHATRERVTMAIHRLGFRPNAQARRIHRRHSEIVCFLLSNRDFPNSFHARILQGVEDCARELKQHVLFAAVQYGSETPPHQIELPSILEERGLFDGLILSGTNHPNFLTRIQKMQIPFVVFGNNVVDFEGEKFFDQVGYDGFQGELDAVRYVIQQGHRDLIFVGDLAYPWVQVRYRAYLAACGEANLNPVAITAPKSLGFVAYGEWACGRILARSPRPTAVIAVNDEVAFGLWRSFRRRGLRVPDDISLIGFDDREEAILMDPPLTTVHVKKEEIGRECMRTLLERLREPERPFVEKVLPVDLIVRATVAAV